MFALDKCFYCISIDYRKARWSCDMDEEIMLWSIKRIYAESSADTISNILPGNISLGYSMPKLSCPWRVKITCLLTVNICRHMGWAMAYFTYGKNKPQCNHCGNGQIWTVIRNVIQQSVLIMSQISSNSPAEICFLIVLFVLFSFQIQSLTHKIVFARVRRHICVLPACCDLCIILFFFFISDISIIQISMACLLHFKQ